MVNKPMFLLLLLAVLALSAVSGASAGAEAASSEQWSMGLETALTALVSGLVTAGLAVPMMVLSVGRWLGVHTEKIHQHESGIAAAKMLAGKALDETRQHIDAHARGEFER